MATTRTRQEHLSLNAAVALLIQTQAEFVKDLAETRKSFAAIERDLETIKAVLVRHETTLEKLTEAIRDKIGFKQ